MLIGAILQGNLVGMLKFLQLPRADDIAKGVRESDNSDISGSQSPVNREAVPVQPKPASDVPVTKPVAQETEVKATKAAQKAQLLAKLGISDAEAKLLLS